MLFWRISLIFTDIFWHIKGYCKLCFMSRAYFLLTDSFWNAALDMHAGELSNWKQKMPEKIWPKKETPALLRSAWPSASSAGHCWRNGAFPKGRQGCLMPGELGMGFITLSVSTGLWWEKTRSMCDTVLRLCSSYLLLQHVGNCLVGQGNGRGEDECVLTKEWCFGSVQSVGSQMLRSHFLHPCWRALLLSCSVMT